MQNKARARSVFTHLNAIRRMLIEFNMTYVEDKLCFDIAVCTSYENFLNLSNKHNYDFNDMSKTDFLVAREIAQNLQKIMSVKYEAEKETIAALERIDRALELRDEK